MNVYAIKGQGKYCSGIIIAAAETLEEARELCKTIITGYDVNYQETNDIEILDVIYNGESKILTEHESGW